MSMTISPLSKFKVKYPVPPSIMDNPVSFRFACRFASELGKICRRKTKSLGRVSHLRIEQKIR